MNSKSHPTARRGVLRLIAAFKFLKAAVLITAGIAALKMLSPEWAADAQAWLVDLVLDPDRHVVAVLAGRAIALVDRTGPDDLKKLAAGALLYAAVFLVEGVGLTLARLWAEYLTVVVSVSFLPIEAVALGHRWTLIRTGTIALNLAVVVYLLARIWAARASRREEVAPRGT